MKILGIETSCDETAVAIVQDDRTIVAQQLISQIDEHTPYGGVVPEIASRAHMQHLDHLIKQCMEDAGCAWGDLDAIAVTGGPGLIGGVIVGVMEAKAIASVHRKPFIAVNHLEGHALTVRLTDDVPFPYLMLLVSGGHCQFLMVHGVGQYDYLGGTIDDALGEAFDKVAKMLELGYPGGPKVEALAKQGDAERFELPMPLCNRKNCDFSFSGLKTAMRHHIVALLEVGTLDEQAKADLCASFQATVGRILINRMRHALAHTPDGLQHVVLAGGVAANQHLRGALETMLQEHGKQLIAPPLALCTDNAAMIAWAGLERFRLGLVDDLSFNPRARWPLTELTQCG
jgi:N6-L-threonylcarbamoyladenine synthase